MNGRDSDHRAGVRRNEAVGDGKSGGHRQREAQNRRAGFQREHEDDRPEKHDPGTEEDRDSDDERDEHHGVIDPRRPKPSNHRGCDDFRRPGFGEQFSEHRAQSDNHREAAHRFAHALVETGREEKHSPQ